jgi:hypothetical protein
MAHEKYPVKYFEKKFFFCLCLLGHSNDIHLNCSRGIAHEQELMHEKSIILKFCIRIKHLEV